MREDEKASKYGQALATLVQNCGAQVRELILADSKLFTSKKVCELAGSRLADRLLTLDLIAEQADRLRDLLAAVETVDGPVGKKSKAHKSDAVLTDKRHAAGGLGLIAKNVRNVAVLRPAHRPTHDQKEQALALTAESRRLTAAAWDACRRAFGRADAACRVRPARTPT